jgi:antitoxin (DNA-binding transcriptional repressor) of toxin-antitoxin stability system
MKTMTVGEIKAHFSEILKEVENGKQIGILYGKTKKSVAMIVPYNEPPRPEGRSILQALHYLRGSATLRFATSVRL